MTLIASLDAAQLDAEKALAADAAAALVEPGMLVGLGTGSTAAHVITALGRRVATGLAITVVGTSLATERAAHAAGLSLRPFDEVAVVHLTIDGVDEVDPQLRAVKGGGGAMLREKIVAEASRHMIAIADSSKTVAQLSRAVPIEVLPFAQAFVSRRLAALGATAVLRLRDGVPVSSDSGNLIIDAAFGPIAAPDALATSLSAVPGILGHGLFLHEIDCAFIGRGNRVERLERVAKPGGWAE